MDSLDKMFVSAMRDFDADIQKAVYYTIFIDAVLLISLCIFIWCCCVYVINYEVHVEESVKLKKSEKQYYAAKAERERLETKRLKLELGLAEDINTTHSGIYGE